jgi:hypothetical protein
VSGSPVRISAAAHGIPVTHAIPYSQAMMAPWISMPLSGNRIKQAFCALPESVRLRFFLEDESVSSSCGAEERMTTARSANRFATARRKK